MARITSYVGGARSGKSRLAVERALALGGRVVFVATLEPQDDEMRGRVEKHRRSRPESWLTVEAPRDLADALRTPGDARCTIVDCLTLWISNRLLAGETEHDILDAFNGVLAAARQSKGEVIFVSNEVGCGVVPESPLGRAFRDIAGLVNQRLAEASDEAYWVVCGRMIRIPSEETHVRPR